MSLALTTGELLGGVAVALGVALLLVGVAWLVTWVLSHSD